MQKKSFSIKRIAIDAVLIAVFFTLSYLSVPIAGIKLSFSSIAIVIPAMIFGPVDGLLVGLLGELMCQLIKYGVDPTTVLWLIPPMLRGLTIGLCMKLLPGQMSISNIWSKKRPWCYLIVCLFAAFLVSTSNTAFCHVFYLIFGDELYKFRWAVYGTRLMTGMISSLITAIIAIPVLKAVHQTGICSQQLAAKNKN